MSPDKCYDKIGVALIFKGHSDEGHTCLPDKPAEEMEKAFRELRLVTVVVPKLQGESPLTAGLLIAYVTSTLKKVADINRQKYFTFAFYYFGHGINNWLDPHRSGNYVNIEVLMEMVGNQCPKYRGDYEFPIIVLIECCRRNRGGKIAPFNYDSIISEAGRILLAFSTVTGYSTPFQHCGGFEHWGEILAEKLKQEKLVHTAITGASAKFIEGQIRFIGERKREVRGLVEQCDKEITEKERDIQKLQKENQLEGAEEEEEDMKELLEIAEELREEERQLKLRKEAIPITVPKGDITNLSLRAQAGK